MLGRMVLAFVVCSKILTGFAQDQKSQEYLPQDISEKYPLASLLVNHMFQLDELAKPYCQKHTDVLPKAGSSVKGLLLPIEFLDKEKHIIAIRTVCTDDFDDIKKLAVATFAQVYQFTTQEKIDGLKKIYDALIEEEIAFFANKNNGGVGLVATCGNKIIGYFSAQATSVPDEIYGRFLMIDGSFQHLGIGKKFFACLMDMFPTAKRVLALTSKSNDLAQKLYEHFGGKRVEDPFWKSYLYKCLNVQNYIGYEFDEWIIQQNLAMR